MKETLQSITARIKAITAVERETSDEFLKDLHFLAGNDWLHAKGTPTRTPFNFLLENSRNMHKRYGWYNTPLEVR